MGFDDLCEGLFQLGNAENIKMAQVVKHMKSFIKIKEIGLTLLILLCLSLKANAQYIPIDGVNTEVFRIYLCADTKKDSGIIGTYLIQRGSNDTVAVNALFKGDTLTLKCDVEYLLIFIGRGEWNYQTNVNVTEGVYMKTVSFCFDRFKNRYRKHWLATDYVLSDGVTLIGGFSERIKKVAVR